MVRSRERQATFPLRARLERTNQGHPSDGSEEEQLSRDDTGQPEEVAMLSQPSTHKATEGTGSGQNNTGVDDVDASDDAGDAVDDAACVVCNSVDDDSNMLLCDGCDDGYHIYCCVPKLRKIPDGDWFCAECRPRKRSRQAKNTAHAATGQKRARSESKRKGVDHGGTNAAACDAANTSTTSDTQLDATAGAARISNGSRRSAAGEAAADENGHADAEDDPSMSSVSKDCPEDATAAPTLPPAPPPPPSRAPPGWWIGGGTGGAGAGRGGSGGVVRPGALGKPCPSAVSVLSASDGWLHRSQDSDGSQQGLGLGSNADTDNTMVRTVHSRRIPAPPKIDIDDGGDSKMRASDSTMLVAPLSLSLSQSVGKLSVVCPASLVAGDKLQVAVPGTAGENEKLRFFDVVVPDSIKAGDLFNVELPANEKSGAAEKPPAGVDEKSAGGGGGSSATSDQAGGCNEVVIASLGPECEVSGSATIIASTERSG